MSNLSVGLDLSGILPGTSRNPTCTSGERPAFFFDGGGGGVGGSLATFAIRGYAPACSQVHLLYTQHKPQLDLPPVAHEALSQTAEASTSPGNQEKQTQVN